MAGMLLSFELEHEENETLTLLCSMAGVKLRRVEPAGYGKTIGMLLGAVPAAGHSADGTLMGDKMLVFSEISDLQLELLLSGIRSLGIAQGSYKAVVTEHNIRWTPSVLMAELRREREELQDKPK